MKLFVLLMLIVCNAACGPKVYWEKSSLELEPLAKNLSTLRSRDENYWIGDIKSYEIESNPMNTDSFKKVGKMIYFNDSYRDGLAVGWLANAKPLAADSLKIIDRFVYCETNLFSNYFAGCYCQLVLEAPSGEKGLSHSLNIMNLEKDGVPLEAEAKVKALACGENHFDYSTLTVWKKWYQMKFGK